MTRALILFSVVALILLAFLYAEYLFSLTGLAASTLSLSVDPATSGKVTMVMIDPPVVDLNSVAEISAEFRNTGSISYSERMVITVMFFNLTQIQNYTDGFTVLDPGERRVFQVGYLANRLGFFWARVNVTYADNRQIIAWGLFSVEIPTVTQPPGPPGPSGPSGPEPPTLPEFPEGYANFTLEYQDHVILTQGQSTLIPIFVTSYGDTSLNNIRFVATMIGMSFDVAPTFIRILTPDSTAIFLLSLDVPPDAQLSTYDFNFQIIADEAEQKGNIAIEVRELPLRDELATTIQNYQYLIQRIGEEIERARLEGKNVSKPAYYLSLAQTGLDRAVQLLDENRYDETRDQLDKVKDDITRAVIELGLLNIPIIFGAILYLFLFILIIIIVALMLLFLYKRKRKKKTEEET